jgi:hypothetical protein
VAARARLCRVDGDLRVCGAFLTVLFHPAVRSECRDG